MHEAISLLVNTYVRRIMHSCRKNVDRVLTPGKFRKVLHLSDLTSCAGGRQSSRAQPGELLSQVKVEKKDKKF